jgi:hypothetical protein
MSSDTSSSDTSSSNISSFNGLPFSDGLSSIPLYQMMMSTVSSSVIISLSDLITSTATLQAIEAANKQRLETFDTAIFLSNLQQWAGSGFKDSYPVYEFSVVNPQKTLNMHSCSDGTPRTVWDYIPFCMGYPITTLVAKLQEKVSDMTLTFSLEDTNETIVLKLHVSRLN